MSSFAQAAVELEPAQTLDWLRPVNERGRQLWREHPFPTRKTEAWKYTSLKRLNKETLRWAEPSADSSLNDLADIPGLDALRIVFVDGVYSEPLSSDALPAGVELVRFASADAEQRQHINRLLGTIADARRHLFVALNESWLRDGLFLHVPANTRLEKPVHVVHLSDAQERDFAVEQRLLVHLERGAEAVLMEHFAGAPDNARCFSNGVSEIELDADARLQHYRVHLEPEQALHIGGVHVNLGRDSDYRGFMLAGGCSLQRLDVTINHLGSGANCDLAGIYLPTGEQHVDFHTTLEHHVGHCTSNEVFRGIVGDRARAVFNGRIHIHPDAQQTSAQLNNRNLLTSRDAEVDTKPELEIYADDVQCAHGATVAQLDRELLHYLRARGIDAEEAEVMLKFGFVNELVLAIKNEAILGWLQQLLEDIFADRAELKRHLP